MNKTRRILDIIWVGLMLFCCSFDFYVMLTNFNVWVLIGFICCGFSAIFKGIQMCKDDIRKERLKDIRKFGVDEKGRTEIPITEYDDESFVDFLNHKDVQKRDTDKKDKGE